MKSSRVALVCACTLVVAVPLGAADEVSLEHRASGQNVVAATALLEAVPEKASLFERLLQFSRRQELSTELDDPPGRIGPTGLGPGWGSPSAP